MTPINTVLDHIVVMAANLDEGVAYCERILGVPMLKGGEHIAMGTHNYLLRRGRDLYLDVIAINPGTTVAHPRWVRHGRRRTTGASRKGPVSCHICCPHQRYRFLCGDIAWHSRYDAARRFAVADHDSGRRVLCNGLRERIQLAPCLTPVVVCFDWTCCIRGQNGSPSNGRVSDCGRMIR